MRLSATLMTLGLLGVLGGAYLIGTVALGVAIIADSVGLVAYGLLRDTAKPDVVSEHDRIREARRQAA